LLWGVHEAKKPSLGKSIQMILCSLQIQVARVPPKGVWTGMANFLVKRLRRGLFWGRIEPKWPMGGGIGRNQSRIGQIGENWPIAESGRLRRI
jgi:hypothetical protein